MQQIVCKVVRESEAGIGIGTHVHNPEDVSDLVGEVMDTLTGDEPRELFVVFHLNSQN